MAAGGGPVHPYHVLVVAIPLLLVLLKRAAARTDRAWAAVVFADIQTEGNLTAWRRV